MRFLGRPGQRVVDIASVDELANQSAFAGRALQRREEREELLPVPRPGVLLQRLPEGKVLWLGLARDLVNVSRDEGEGVFRVAFVLGPDEGTPGRPRSRPSSVFADIPGRRFSLWRPRMRGPSPISDHELWRRAGVMTSAPGMGGTVCANDSLSSSDSSGTTSGRGSTGSRARHILATKARPTSRQYESVG
jgi:hypothetical protein